MSNFKEWGVFNAPRPAKSRTEESNKSGQRKKNALNYRP